MHTFKQVLIKTCNKTVNLSCIFILDKKDIIWLMIAFVWNSELHEYLSFVLRFLNIYLWPLYWALWFSYRPSLYIMYTYTYTLYLSLYLSIYLSIYLSKYLRSAKSEKLIVNWSSHHKIFWKVLQPGESGK